jgi:hypothetical protein
MDSFCCLGAREEGTNLKRVDLSQVEGSTSQLFKTLESRYVCWLRLACMRKPKRGDVVLAQCQDCEENTLEREKAMRGTACERA